MFVDRLQKKTAYSRYISAICHLVFGSITFIGRSSMLQPFRRPSFILKKSVQYVVQCKCHQFLLPVVYFDMQIPITGV